MSQHDDNNDLGAIAWPGFVDILSAVIIMFVFFLMIVATALYFHIIIYVSKIESSIVAERVENEQEFEFSQIQTEFAESKDQKVSFDAEKKEFVIFFGQDAISVTPEVKKEVVEGLVQFFQNNKQSEYDIEITASRPDKSLENISRQVSVARMLNVRNTVIEAELDVSLVKPKIAKAYPIMENEHWVKIELNKK